jgi:NNP family nitrate/nitrite transporter-like MFS transporter
LAVVRPPPIRTSLLNGLPRGFGASIAATGGPNLALEVFLAFYVTCVALTWRYYLRNRQRGARNLAEAHV